MKTISISELNRLEINSYNYLLSAIGDKSNLIISRNMNHNQDNNFISFMVEDKNLDNELTYFQLSLRKSITKYFAIVKHENNCLLIRQ